MINLGLLLVATCALGEPELISDGEIRTHIDGRKWVLVGDEVTVADAEPQRCRLDAQPLDGWTTPTAGIHVASVVDDDGRTVWRQPFEVRFQPLIAAEVFGVMPHEGGVAFRLVTDGAIDTRTLAVFAEVGHEAPDGDVAFALHRLRDVDALYDLDLCEWIISAAIGGPAPDVWRTLYVVGSARENGVWHDVDTGALEVDDLGGEPSRQYECPGEADPAPACWRWLWHPGDVKNSICNTDPSSFKGTVAWRLRCNGGWIDADCRATAVYLGPLGSVRNAIEEGQLFNPHDVVRCQDALFGFGNVTVWLDGHGVAPDPVIEGYARVGARLHAIYHTIAFAGLSARMKVAGVGWAAEDTETIALGDLLPQWQGVGPIVVPMQTSGRQVVRSLADAAPFTVHDRALNLQTVNEIEAEVAATSSLLDLTGEAHVWTSDEDMTIFITAHSGGGNIHNDGGDITIHGFWAPGSGVLD